MRAWQFEANDFQTTREFGSGSSEILLQTPRSGKSFARTKLFK
jgi:hypothetical protein